VFEFLVRRAFISAVTLALISLIVFTGGPDDAFGGDTYGDGATTQPYPQSWANISFSSERLMKEGERTLQR